MKTFSCRAQRFTLFSEKFVFCENKFNGVISIWSYCAVRLPCSKIMHAEKRFCRRNVTRLCVVLDKRTSLTSERPVNCWKSKHNWLMLKRNLPMPVTTKWEINYELLWRRIKRILFISFFMTRSQPSSEHGRLMSYSQKYHVWRARRVVCCHSCRLTRHAQGLRLIVQTIENCVMMPL